MEKVKTNFSPLLVIFVGFIVALTVLYVPRNFIERDRNDAIGAVATTSVTVLNTPPEWASGGDAQELTESSVALPTNAGTQQSWIGTATDPNSENYYLLICKTSTAPTARSNQAPVCAGGAGNQWAVSPSTTSSIQATSTYTTQNGDLENNPWWAFICDGNTFTPRCNATYKQGSGDYASPMVINHKPNFTTYSDDSPKNPGQVVTWATNASDTDSYVSTDQVALIVCKGNDFSGGACGALGTYCSTTLVALNPTCSTTLDLPLPDKNYTAFGHVIDTHNFSASGGAEGGDSVLTVNNMAPSVSNVVLLDKSGSATTSLSLSSPGAQTSGFKVTFTVSDDNSCSNASNTAQEVTSALIDVYRLGIGSSSCMTTGNYNPNNCYPGTISTSTWGYLCTETTSTCSGPTDFNADWVCTFPLWFLSDATDGFSDSDTQYYLENWFASAQAKDNNNATSAYLEASEGKDLATYAAYSLTTPLISYGSLSPGSTTDPLAATTSVSAVGNTGLDTILYGDYMCTTYPACIPGSNTSTIDPTYQHYATSPDGYATSTSLQLNPGVTLPIHILKSTQTSSPAYGWTYWGIQIPGTITKAGLYSGQNTIIGDNSPAQTW